MTSFADTAVTREPDIRFALREAMMAEREAYERMRSLVPDLALPRERRRPLTEAQREAIEVYQELRERVEAIRGSRRGPRLSVDRDQSV